MYQCASCGNEQKYLSGGCEECGDHFSLKHMGKEEEFDEDDDLDDDEDDLDDEDEVCDDEDEEFGDMRNEKWLD